MKNTIELKTSGCLALRCIDAALTKYMQYSPFIYLLQVLIIYSTSLSTCSTHPSYTVPTPGTYHLPHQGHAVPLHIPTSGNYHLSHQVHTILTLHIYSRYLSFTSPSTYNTHPSYLQQVLIIYLTKNIQYSPFISTPGTYHLPHQVHTILTIHIYSRYLSFISPSTCSIHPSYTCSRYSYSTQYTTLDTNKARKHTLQYG